MMSWLKRLLHHSRDLPIPRDDRARVEEEKREFAEALHDERGRLHWLELNRAVKARTPPRIEE